MTPERDDEARVTRERLVQAALGLIQDEGLEGLSMRGLAERLDVRAASLYWHVRDRRELLDLLAESVLDSVRVPPAGGSWRTAVLGAASALAEQTSAQKDAARILLEAPEALQASALLASIKDSLVGAGLAASEAGDVARMAMVYAIAGRQAEDQGGGRQAHGTDDASIAIDSGSRGVVLRAGSDLEGLFRIARDRTVAAPAVVRGETVIVRRLRGVGLGEIELSRRRAWRVRIQGPTWNTVVDAGGLDLREIKLDSGAAKVECFLPRPRGMVPILVSGGVVGVSLHRPAGVGVVAEISTGAVKLKLDSFATRAAVQDLRWESDGASTAADRYALRISGGAVQVTLDSNMAGHDVTDTPPEPPPSRGESASALEILLDGVQALVASRRPSP